MSQVYHAHLTPYFTEPTDGFQPFEYVRERENGTNRAEITIYCLNREHFLACLDWWNACAKVSQQPNSRKWQYTEAVLSMNSRDMF